MKRQSSRLQGSSVIGMGTVVDGNGKCRSYGAAGGADWSDGMRKEWKKRVVVAGVSLVVCFTFTIKDWSEL